jgi:hypothetical protein
MSGDDPRDYGVQCEPITNKPMLALLVILVLLGTWFTFRSRDPLAGETQCINVARVFPQDTRWAYDDREPIRCIPLSAWEVGILGGRK